MVYRSSIKVSKGLEILIFQSFAFLLLLLISTSLYSQSKVQVLSKDDGQPIFLAHVKFLSISGESKTSFKWVVTDQQGYATNPFNDTCIVEVSHVGFSNFKSIVLPNSSLKIKLESSSFGLNELVVTAQFIPVEMQKSVYKVQTIKEENIVEKGANNLREALSSELNFKTNNGHVNETAINLNGLSGNHVKFMIDGVPVEGRLSGNIDLSQINLNEIDKIEVIEGPTSVAYGTNALGGVINVITKKNQFKKVDVDVKSYYETVGQYNLSGKIGWKQKRNLYKISGGRNFFQGFANSDTSRYKDWKPREQYFGSFLFSRRIHHLKLSYIFDGFYEKMTSRGAPRAPYFVNAFDTHYKTNRWSNKLLLSGRLVKDNFVDITVAQSYYQRSRNIYFKDLTTLQETLTDSDTDQDTTTFKNYLFRGVYSSNSDSSKINVVLGVELKQDYIEAERVTDYTQNIGDYACFGNIRYNPTKSITIQPGVRYGYNTKYKSPIVPSINLLFNLGENTTLRTSYAKGFRAPDLKELYLEFHYNSTINLYGSEDLTSENSDHFNLSLDYVKNIEEHKLKLNPKVFYSRINNLIDLAQTSPINWTYTNIDYLITQGGSFLVDYNYKKINVSTAINHYGNYNSQFSTSSNANNFFYSTDVTSGFSYLLDTLDLKFNLNYKYTGRLRSYYIDDNNVVTESMIDDFHTFDLSSTKYFLNKKINLNVGVKNLFDVKNIKMVGQVFGVSNSSNATSLNVLWGRSYFVSLNLNF